MKNDLWILWMSLSSREREVMQKIINKKIKCWVLELLIETKTQIRRENNVRNSSRV